MDVTHPEARVKTPINRCGTLRCLPKINKIKLECPREIGKKNRKRNPHETLLAKQEKNSWELCLPISISGWKNHLLQESAFFLPAGDADASAPCRGALFVQTPDLPHFPPASCVFQQALLSFE